MLQQHADSLTLHTGGALQGGIRRWAWSVTGSYDRMRSASTSDQGVPLDTLQAAVAAGADPLTTIDAASAAQRLVEASRTVTTTLVSKAVVNGPLLRVPAGDVQMTMSADYGRSSSSGTQAFAPDPRFGFARTTRTASIAATVPIASADRDVLPFLGALSISGMVGVSAVSRADRLATSSYSANWAPGPRIQFSATISDAQTPPDITLLTAPVVTTPNTPFFDFTTGNSVLVTVLTGGRAELLPERRQRAQFGVALTPITGKELRVSVDYIDTRLRNQAATLGSATPAFQAAFPGAFVRDATGKLVSVDLRSVNLAREQDRQLRFALNLSTPLGRVVAPPLSAPPSAPPSAPLPPSASAAGASGAVASPPAAPAKPRPTLTTSVTTTLRLSDRLTLQPGTGALDLLDGATLTGTGGQPRLESEIQLRGTAGAVTLAMIGRVRGPTRIRSDLAQSDLRFSGRTWLVPYISLEVGKIVPRPWAHAMSVDFIVENLLNDRIEVRDRTGATPNRFQAAYLDPIGRSLRLALRKQF